MMVYILIHLTRREEIHHEALNALPRDAWTRAGRQYRRRVQARAGGAEEDPVGAGGPP